MLGGDSFSLKERTRCLVGIYTSLDENARAGLELLLKKKKRWQDIMSRLLALQEVIKRSARENKEDYERLLNSRAVFAHQLVVELSLMPEDPTKVYI